MIIMFRQTWKIFFIVLGSIQLIFLFISMTRELPQINLLNSGELTPKQNFSLVNTSRKSLKKLFSTADIPPGLVISSSFNWPRKLFHAFVSQICSVQCSLLWGCPAQHSKSHPTHSELTRLEIHEPENTLARPWPTVDSPSSALSTRAVDCLQRPNTLYKSHESNSPLRTSNNCPIFKSGPAFCLLKATALVIL